MPSSLKKIALGSALSLASFQSVFAECTLNGEIIPCGQMPEGFWYFMAFGLLLGLVLFSFWVWMLVDAIRFQQENRVLWILGFFFFGGFTAIAYYFIEKRPRTQKTV